MGTEKIRLTCHYCSKRVESSPGEPPCEVMRNWYTVSHWKKSGEVARFNFCSRRCLSDWIKADFPEVPGVYLKSFPEDQTREDPGKIV